MPALQTDKFLLVGTPGTATNLAGAGYTVGATSITVTTTSNWPTETGVVFGMDVIETSADGIEVRVDGSYCVFSGVVTSGTTIGSLTREYGTPQNYAAGANTRVYITVSTVHNKRLVEGILAHANQDGTLKDNAVATATIANNAVSTAKIADNAITNVKVAAGISTAKLFNPHKFRASQNAAANTGNNAFAVIPFDTEQFDTGNNVLLGVFTVPLTGFYQFNWNSVFTLSAGVDETGMASLFVNGAEVSRGSLITYRNLQGSHGSDIVSLTAGQTVDVRVFAPSVRALSVGNAVNNFFSGYLVSLT